MSNLNKVLIMGNLTRDPEIRHTSHGTAVGELGIAVNHRVKVGDEWKEETTFIDATVWGNTAENAGKYLTKGRGVFVEGRLQLDTWDDKDTGQKRSKLKVVAANVQFLPGKGEGQPKAPTTAPQGHESWDDFDKKAEAQTGGDDIPF